MNGDNIRPYGPGKFDLVIDSHVWGQAMNGWCSDEAGNVDEHGVWYGLLQGTPFDDNNLEVELNRDEQDYLRSFVGAIVSEDSQGFVHIEYYASQGALRAAWREVEREVYELDWGADESDCDPDAKAAQDELEGADIWNAQQDLFGGAV